MNTPSPNKMRLRQRRVIETFCEIKSPVLHTPPKQTIKRNYKKTPKTKINLSYDSDDLFTEESQNINPAAAESIVTDELETQDPFYLAKKALHTSNPAKLTCREPQIDKVYGYITKHLRSKIAGSLYISGAPGTGKTAVIQHVLNKLNEPEAKNSKKLLFTNVFVNCMNLVTPSLIFEHIGAQLKIKKGSVSELKANLEHKFISKTGRMIILVLDEMDHLISSSNSSGRANEVVQTLFEWTRLENSKLIVIGVANALDLAVRSPALCGSPKLNSSPKSLTPKSRTSSKATKPIDIDSSCQVMNFPPYEREDIALILEERLTNIDGQVFDPMAIKFVAGKVAASTGDMRKALNACKQALDAMEKQQDRQVLKPKSDDAPNCTSPSKKSKPSDRINLQAVYHSFVPQKYTDELPLQQQLILATLLRINHRAPNSKTLPFDGVKTAIPIASLYDEYRRICNVKGFSFIDRSEMISLCGLLEDRALVSMTQAVGTPSSSRGKGGKQQQQNKAGIYFDPKGADGALRNSDILTSVLES